jgi:ABC-2 type transport system permease protein
MISRQRLQVVVAHELRLAKRDPIPILVLIVFPIITMAFLKPAFRPALVQSGHPHANGSEQVVPGEATLSAFFIVSLITVSFFAEYAWGTWDRLRASAATSLEIVLGKAIPRVVMTVAQFAVVVGAGLLFFGLDIRGSAAALIPLVVTFAVCLVLLGVAVTAVCHTAQQAQAFAVVGMVLFGAIGGALVPFSVLPHWARVVAPVTPTYWAMRGFTSVILDGRGFGGVEAPIAALAAMALAFGVLALRRLRFDDHKTGWA